MRSLILPTLGPVGLVFLFVTGVVALGREAEQSLRAGADYRTPFAEVACAPPAALSREAFLREVQYEADLPDELDRLDSRLTERLRNAFARHPWVEKVERVEVRPDAIEVRLSYREPVLAVRGAERTQAVSAAGVLLPRAAVSPDLPLLKGSDVVPAGRAGEEWGSATVESAAHVATLLRPHRRQVPVVALEFSGKELVLWTANGSRIVWGQPRENEEEPSADLKCGRLVSLLEHAAQSESPVEIDLRRSSGATHRVLLVTADNGGTEK